MPFDDAILREPGTGLVLDARHAPSTTHPRMPAALRAMAELEAGAIANPDEGRQVGHYWLREPALAPDTADRAAIEQSWRDVAALRRGDATDVLLCGIGGSALGPAMLAHALARPGDAARLHLLDNTDPDGFERVLAHLDPARTLVLVISKSGGTVETRNAMLAAMVWMRRGGQPFCERAIAITVPGSKLDRLAQGQLDGDDLVAGVLGPTAGPWRARLSLWPWVGGRTSVTGTVGLAVLELCGWHATGLLDGARAMDAATRLSADQNPAAWLAASWFSAGQGTGERALVVLPYRDRLGLLGRYLQQLIMESLGKRLDRQGRPVLQGLTVYGNKGSTDQHAFIQQVRDGRDDTFVHFVEVTDPGASSPGDGGYDAADHLLGFRLGTEEALAEAGRPSLTLRVPDVSERSLGALIALFERAVGLYAELVDLNAYHQPGVEAGKRAARQTLDRLDAIAAALDEDPRAADEIGQRAGVSAPVAWRLLDHLAASGRALKESGERPATDRFCLP